MRVLVIPKDIKFEDHLKSLNFRIDKKNPEVLFIKNNISGIRLFFHIIGKKPKMIFARKRYFFLSKTFYSYISFNSVLDFFNIKEISSEFPKAALYILSRLGIYPVVREIKRDKNETLWNKIKLFLLWE